MKIFKNIFTSIKSNWKAMLFAVVYTACFFITIACSFGINDYIKGGDYL